MPLVSPTAGLSMAVRISGVDLSVHQVKHQPSGNQSEGWICCELGKVRMGWAEQSVMWSDRRRVTAGKIYSISLDSTAWRELNTDRCQDLSIEVWIDGIRTERRAVSKKGPPAVVFNGPHCTRDREDERGGKKCCLTNLSGRYVHTISTISPSNRAHDPDYLKPRILSAIGRI